MSSWLGGASFMAVECRHQSVSKCRTEPVGCLGAWAGGGVRTAGARGREWAAAPVMCPAAVSSESSRETRADLDRSDGPILGRVAPDTPLGDGPDRRAAEPFPDELTLSP